MEPISGALLTTIAIKAITAKFAMAKAAELACTEVGKLAATEVAQTIPFEVSVIHSVTTAYQALPVAAEIGSVLSGACAVYGMHTLHQQQIKHVVEQHKQAMVKLSHATSLEEIQHLAQFVSQLSEYLQRLGVSNLAPVTNM